MSLCGSHIGCTVAGAGLIAHHEMWKGESPSRLFGPRTFDRGTKWFAPPASQGHLLLGGGLLVSLKRRRLVSAVESCLHDFPLAARQCLPDSRQCCGAFRRGVGELLGEELDGLLVGLALGGRPRVGSAGRTWHC